jgi:hypothetical protein
VAGSGIVSRPASSGFLHCYFEGNLNKYSNVEDYADKLKIAAGRCGVEYATIARARVPEYAMKKIGSYDGYRYVVTEISDPEALAQWCGETPEQVMGVRLPAGPATWNDAAEAIRIGSRQVTRLEGTDDHVFTSRAGQIFVFNGTEKTATVYEYDDPAAWTLLAPHLDDVLKRLTFGEVDKPSDPASDEGYGI